MSALLRKEKWADKMVPHLMQSLHPVDFPRPCDVIKRGCHHDIWWRSFEHLRTFDTAQDEAGHQAEDVNSAQNPCVGYYTQEVVNFSR